MHCRDVWNRALGLLRVRSSKLRQREVGVRVDDALHYFAIDDGPSAAASNRWTQISTLSCLAKEPHNRRGPDAKHSSKMIAATKPTPMRFHTSLTKIE